MHNKSFIKSHGLQTSLSPLNNYNTKQKKKKKNNGREKWEI